MAVRKAIEERFWIKVDKKGEEDCWCWCAATVKGGSGERKLTYGVIGTDRNASGNPKVLLAHRVSWEMHNGPIPEGKYIDHICHNTLCKPSSPPTCITKAKRREPMCC